MPGLLQAVCYTPDQSLGADTYAGVGSVDTALSESFLHL